VCSISVRSEAGAGSPKPGDVDDGQPHRPDSGEGKQQSRAQRCLLARKCGARAGCNVRGARTGRWGPPLAWPRRAAGSRRGKWGRWLQTGLTVVVAGAFAMGTLGVSRLLARENARRIDSQFSYVNCSLCFPPPLRWAREARSSRILARGRKASTARRTARSWIGSRAPPQPSTPSPA
jgi:hypothetical protein